MSIYNGPNRRHDLITRQAVDKLKTEPANALLLFRLATELAKPVPDESEIEEIEAILDLRTHAD
jgi:hypothetical protein